MISVIAGVIDWKIVLKRNHGVTIHHGLLLLTEDPENHGNEPHDADNSENGMKVND
jgi:hypothetical protein